MLKQLLQAILGARAGIPCIWNPTFLSGFLFTSPSLLSLGVWLTFFILYNKMATYEEKDLIRILGEEYIAYQKRVPKWLPRIRHGIYSENKLG